MIVLALRYLRSKPRQTILMLLGIFLGSAAFVAISGFMLGFREYMIDQLINNDAHIHIQAREDYLSEHTLDKFFYGRVQHVFWDPPPSGRKDSAMIEGPEQWYRRLYADLRVIAYSPQLKASVIFTNGKTTVPATIIGCDPKQQVRVTTIGHYLTKGQFSALLAGGNRLIIGDRLKKKLGIEHDQTVLVSLGKDQPTPFKIVGFFNTGNRQTDNFAYGALSDIQRVNRTPNQVNEIIVKLTDHTQAAELANFWSALGAEKVESWDQINSSIYDMFKVQDAVRFVSVGAILLVAGFGIYNVLNITVVQKKRDIAILRSMGFETKEVLLLFLFQGIILGFIGTSLGLIAGYLISLYLETVPFRGGGPIGVSPGHLMVSFNFIIYRNAALLAFTSTLIASLLPAWSASQLTPIEIIRSGLD